MTQIPDIDTLIDKVIALEGDYSDHPADRGGPTRWGVTEAVARAQGYAGDIIKFMRPDFDTEHVEAAIGEIDQHRLIGSVGTPVPA
uniref:glycosyl hydrolase 108 family protein n=1 Tax=Parasphingorhabdus sp. TaxID=2709688 RepID=UPI00359318C9